jgi:hypothetical protein
MGAWTDLTLITLTFVLAVVESLEVGIITSMLISLLLVVHRSSKTRLTILVRLTLALEPCFGLSSPTLHRVVFRARTDGDR